jgi:signal transduction histidine kinase
LRLGLTWRIFAISVLGVVLALAGTAIFAANLVQQTTDRALEERLVLAQTVAGRVDDYLTHTIHITELTIKMSKVDPGNPSPDALQDLVKQVRANLGNAAYYVAYISPDRQLLAVDPPVPEVQSHDWVTAPCVASLYENGKPVITRSSVLGTPAPMVAMVVPALDAGGKVAGAVFTSLTLSDPAFTNLLQPLNLGETGAAEIVDSQAVILASTNPGLQWQSADHWQSCSTLVANAQPTVESCHSCHEEASGSTVRRSDILAFAPLSSGRWGVALHQSQEEVFAEATALREKLLWFGGVILLVTLLAVWLLVRRLVRPVQGLTRACQEIASGNLDVPVPVADPDEIGTLAVAFEEMRVRTKEARAQVVADQSELEQRVARRTEELTESRGQLLAANKMLQEKEEGRRLLLRQVIDAQEEERCRIGRELHDETSQALAALSIGLETATVAPASRVAEVKARLEPLKGLAGDMLAEIQRMIRDLRPSVLDDLGLISAIDWYAEVRLKSMGVRVEWEVRGEERRLATEIETVAFRLAQEAISNAARHANPTRVRLSLTFGTDALMLRVEDDGRGFDSSQVLADPIGAGAYGLAGMNERLELLGGQLAIESSPGAGTVVQVCIPLDETHESHQCPRVAGKERRNCVKSECCWLTTTRCCDKGSAPC